MVKTVSELDGFHASNVWWIESFRMSYRIRDMTTAIASEAERWKTK